MVELPDTAAASEAPERNQDEELLHQTQEIVKSLSIAFTIVNKTFTKPDPMAAAAALVQMQAAYLTSIPDHRFRKQVRKRMDHELSVRLARMIAAQERGEL